MNGNCGNECPCAVDSGHFCSEWCEDRGGMGEVEAIAEKACQCGHAACAGV